MTYKNKTIRRHRRGNWWTRFYHEGKQYSIYGRTQLDCYGKLKIIVDRLEQESIIAKAEQYLQKLNHPRHQIVTQAVAEPPQAKFTLIQWFDEWLASCKAGTVRLQSQKNYRYAFQKMKSLHDTPLTEITNLTLSKVISSIVCSKQTHDNIRSILKQMFAVAHNNKLIDNNPTLNLPKPNGTPKKKRQALTPEQEQRFIETALTDTKYEPLLICLLQGVRKGEMLAIRPNDLDFDRNTLRIDESYDEQNPQDLQTKNADSNRTMPMFELTRKLLTKYKDHEPTQRIYEKHTSAKMYKALRELQELADLPKFCIHELRHTFITRCHEKKIDEMITQRWVGHQVGSRMTKAVYTHISHNAELEYIEQMNAKTS